MSCISVSVYGPWQQFPGTAGFNIESLITNGIYNFTGGQTGAYLSTDSAANYSLSNNGNDNFRSTRGFTKDNNYIVKVLLEALTMEQLGF